MDVLAFVFSSSAALLLSLSGLSKIVSLKESAESIVKLEIMPEKLARLMGIIFPFIEVLVAILLLVANSNILVNGIAAALFIAFIAINFRAIIQPVPTECSCFGNLIKSELGYGGLVQSLLLLCSIVPSIVFNTQSFSELINLGIYPGTLMTMAIASVFWAVTLLCVRKIIEMPSSAVK